MAIKENLPIISLTVLVVTADDAWVVTMSAPHVAAVDSEVSWEHLEVTAGGMETTRDLVEASTRIMTVLSKEPEQLSM